MPLALRVILLGGQHALVHCLATPWHRHVAGDAERLIPDALMPVHQLQLQHRVDNARHRCLACVVILCCRFHHRPRAGYALPIVDSHAFPLATCFACSLVSYLPTSRCPCHTLYSSRPPCRVRLIIHSPLAMASPLSRRHFTAPASGERSGGLVGARVSCRSWA